jgi:hypothetical protein
MLMVLIGEMQHVIQLQLCGMHMVGFGMVMPNLFGFGTLI